MFNFVASTLGVIILTLTDKHPHKTTQHILLINIAATEGVLNMLRVVYLFLILQGVHFPEPHVRVTNVNIASVFGATGIHYIHHLGMFYLTFDRLLLVIFPFKYNNYCTRGRAKKLLACTWSINLLLSLVLSVVLKYVGYSCFNVVTYDVMFTYIPAFFNVVFLLFALIVYSLMFIKFSKSSRTTKQETNGRTSLWNVFKRSRFFVSLLLISSCLVFNVVPRLVYSFILINDPAVAYNSFFAYVSISVAVGDTADSVIYIFLQPFVRQFLSTKYRALYRSLHREKQENEFS